MSVLLGLALVVAVAGSAPRPRGAAIRPTLASRIDGLMDRAPFDRATWAAIVTDSTGSVLYERNADRLLMPASNNKLLVTSAALALLGPTFRTTTTLHATEPLERGVLHGDLVAVGGGDPMFSSRCYRADTLLRDCDSLWAGMDDLVRQLTAHGVTRIDGAIVGDGSAFEPRVVHNGWALYDLNWWYAAPVSGLGFNDNSVDLIERPGPAVGAPALVSLQPDLHLIHFDNRSTTGPAGSPRTLEFYRAPGTMNVWAEGSIPLDDPGLTEYFALPDPNLYFAEALRSRLVARGVTVKGPAQSTTDSLSYRDARRSPALATRSSRPVSDWIFPILNTSQNWFAEMLLKTLGRERGGIGSWQQGISIERRFFTDQVGVDSTSLWPEDGSGLSTGNLVTPRALARILAYDRRGSNAEVFLRALPRSGRPGSLHRRFVGTPLEGRVVAKTGSIEHVHSLSGFVERPSGGPLVFSIIVNDDTAPSRRTEAEIDSVVVEAARLPTAQPIGAR